MYLVLYIGSDPTKFPILFQKLLPEAELVLSILFRPLGFLAPKDFLNYLAFKYFGFAHKIWYLHFYCHIPPPISVYFFIYYLYSCTCSPLAFYLSHSSSYFCIFFIYYLHVYSCTCGLHFYCHIPPPISVYFLFIIYMYIVVLVLILNMYDIFVVWCYATKKQSIVYA